MRLTTLLRRLLGVTQMYVKQVEMAADGPLTVSVEPSWRRSRCGTCGKRAPRYDRQPVREWRHLSWGRMPAWLRYAPWRVSCRRCRGVKVEQVPWASGSSVFTSGFEELGLSSNGCGWVEARSAGRRGVLAARVASELTAHGVHLTGGGRGAPWPGVGRSGVAAGRPACQRATRVLRCATALRVTHRPSLRSSSRYGPCGPAWTGASRPSTTTRKARRLAVRG